jgi:hypothetical protein
MSWFQTHKARLHVFRLRLVDLLRFLGRDVVLIPSPAFLGYVRFQGKYEARSKLPVKNEISLACVGHGQLQHGTLEVVAWKLDEFERHLHRVVFTPSVPSVVLLCNGRKDHRRRGQCNA